jgi:hypothetical protein
MLLHVIEAPRPVDATENVRTVRAAIDDMNDFVAIVANVEDVCVSDFSQIIWLTARSWVESRAIQN